MTKTHYTLRDFGGEQGLGWPVLAAFVRHLGIDSALYLDTHPDEAETIAWARGFRNGALLADLIDVGQWTQWTLAALHSKSKPKQPRPYRRPWATDDGKRIVGHDPIPVGSFEDWWAKN